MHASDQNWFLFLQLSSMLSKRFPRTTQSTTRTERQEHQKQSAKYSEVKPDISLIVQDLLISCSSDPALQLLLMMLSLVNQHLLTFDNEIHLKEQKRRFKEEDDGFTELMAMAFLSIIISMHPQSALTPVPLRCHHISATPCHLFLLSRNHHPYCIMLIINLGIKSTSGQQYRHA
jgi:hypothetical protein